MALETTAIGAVDRAGGAPLLRGRLLVNIAQVWNKKGDAARALTIVEEAVRALEQALVPSDTDLAQALTIPVIASGGLSDIADIEQLCAVESEGVEGVICGRSIYSGALDFAAAQARADELGAG